MRSLAKEFTRFILLLSIFSVSTVGQPFLVPGTGISTAAEEPYDFSLSIRGPQHVVRGYDLYVQIDSQLLSGSRDYIFYDAFGLPPETVVSYPDLDEYCCGGNRGWAPGPTQMKIQTAPGTALGTYDLLLRATSGGVTRETTHRVKIDPVPAPLPRVEGGQPPPIPRLQEWEDNMRQWGQTHCQPIAGMWEGYVWYYDGMRVYQQIADYTGDAAWLTCADYSKEVYRGYVLQNNGGVQGWRVFPHGLRSDFLRNGDEASRQAVHLLALNSAFASKGGGVDPGLVRETAYLVHAYRAAESLGDPQHPKFDRAVDFLLGHLDQWFVSETEPYMQPFMVGLACEALIQYYEESRDPRVPPAIKTALDALWNWAWVAEDMSFFYESTGDTTQGAPDLNMLIAPAFGWLYAMTGDVSYRERGDLIFEGGVLGAWLGGGKQFSQNYRWSPDYVKWRSTAPDTEPPTAPTGLTATVISSREIDLSWTASTDNGGVTGYIIYQNGKEIGTTAGTSYRSTGLKASTRYTYRVVAYDEAGNRSVKSVAVTKTTQPAPSAKFTMDDRVRTVKKANARSTPSKSGTVLGTQPKAAVGTVVGGPWYWNQTWWWQIDFDSGIDGWVAQGKLKKVVP
jgi:chitodextrinase